MAQQQWQVEPIKGRCAVTGAVIEQGQEFYTVLFEDGESFRREDYSASAWTGPPEGCFCTFKSRMPVKERRKKLFVDDDVLVNFFIRLAEETEPVRVQFRFVLALMLMRKRILKYDGSRVENGVEVWSMIMPKDQTTHRVINPALTDNQIGGVSEQLTAILNTDAMMWGDRDAEGADARGTQSPEGS